MKALTIAAIILFITVSSASATVTGINIIFQTHHAWGWAYGSPPQSYDLTSSDPVSASIHVQMPVFGIMLKASLVIFIYQQLKAATVPKVLLMLNQLSYLIQQALSYLLR